MYRKELSQQKPPKSGKARAAEDVSQSVVPASTVERNFHVTVSQLLPSSISQAHAQRFTELEGGGVKRATIPYHEVRRVLCKLYHRNSWRPQSLCLELILNCCLTSRCVQPARGEDA